MAIASSTLSDLLERMVCRLATGEVTEARLSSIARLTAAT